MQTTNDGDELYNRDEDLENTCREIPQSPAERRVREWVGTNRENFSTKIVNAETGEVEPKWKPLEVMQLAIELGMDPVAVTEVIGHWKDALGNTRVELRAAQEFYKTKVAYEQFERLKQEAEYKKNPFLMDAKQALRDYQIEGKDF